MRFSDLMDFSLNKLGDAGQALEIELLIEKVFSMDRKDFWIKKSETISDKNGLKRFYRMYNKLLENEPISYILGEKEFYSRKFFVNRNVLIPRPETELLVEKVLSVIRPGDDVLEIGAGSGVISITLALEVNCKIIAIEKSTKALPILKKNIALHGITKRMMVIHSDLFPPNHSFFDIVVSNPPYLSKKEWEELPTHIKKYEPKMALIAGLTGYEYYKRIINGSRKRVKESGYLALEIGINQKEYVNSLLRKYFQEIRWFKDYQSIDRVVIAKKR